VKSNTIALALSKGGSGKTTTAVNLGHGLALRDKRVCLIDCDTQAHLAIALGVEVRPGRTLAEVLTGEQKFARCAVEARKNLWLVPSEKTSLARAKLAMAQDELGTGALWLQDRLKEINGLYDHIILDTAPGWDLLSIAVLYAAQKVILPVSTEYLSLVGATDYVHNVEAARKRNPMLHIELVLPTFLDARVGRSVEALALIRQAFGPIVAEPIRVNTDLSEAMSHHKTIFEHSPSSRGAEDYDKLVSLVLLHS
jgi:chromosome partitioning protein